MWSQILLRDGAGLLQSHCFVKRILGFALSVFFFQAEDGIRDLTVTGVQTCALPISTVSWPSLRMGFSPTVVSDTRMPSPIKVRWHPDLNDGDRAKLEHQYGLSNGRSDDRTTFSYDLVDHSPAIVRALVNDPHVMDTHGINRGASSVDVPWWDRWGEKVGVGRIAWGPFTREGA